MTRLLASIAALALVAAQASAAPTNDTPKITKASLSCGGSSKAVKTARVENRCETEDRHVGTTALVFGAAAVAGVVAIAVSTNGNHGNGTSP